MLIALSPQQYGLYSAFMGCFVYFILGTSRDVTLGPTAIMSLLVSSYTLHEPAYAVLLAFLSGCIQLAMGFLCLGETLWPSCGGAGGCGPALPGEPRQLRPGLPRPQHFLISKGRPCRGGEGDPSLISCSPDQPKQGVRPAIP